MDSVTAYSMDILEDGNVVVVGVKNVGNQKYPLARLYGGNDLLSLLYEADLGVHGVVYAATRVPGIGFAFAGWLSSSVADLDPSDTTKAPPWNEGGFVSLLHGVWQ